MTDIKKAFQTMTRKAKKNFEFKGYVRFTMNSAQMRLGTGTVSVTASDKLGETRNRREALASLKEFRKTALFQDFLKAINATSSMEESERKFPEEVETKYSIRLHF